MPESFFKQLPEIKKQIDQTVDDIFNAEKDNFLKISKASFGVFKNTNNFVVRGDSLRGAIFYFVTKNLGYKNEKTLYSIAAAIELINSAMIIKSDIAINETFRRHRKSIFAELSDLSEFSHNTEIFKSVSASAADFLVFLSMKVFSNAIKSLKNRDDLFSCFINTYSDNRIANIEKLFQTINPKNISKDKIINIFKYEEGRQTFSLPLVLAALITNQSKDSVKDFDELGEIMGIIFEIREDDVDFYVESIESGRTTMLGVSKNIKNLIHLCLYKNSTKIEKKILDKNFGAKKISKLDREKLKKLYVSTGAYKEVCQIKSTFTKRALDILKQMKLSNDLRTAILDLLIHSISRTT